MYKISEISNDNDEIFESFRVGQGVTAHVLKLTTYQIDDGNVIPYNEYMNEFDFSKGNVYEFYLKHANRNSRIRLYSTSFIESNEAYEYMKRGFNKYSFNFEHILVHIDGDFVDIEYTFKESTPFQRIRRITGYLVGTLERFNDAKRAEESERVKHGVKH